MDLNADLTQRATARIEELPWRPSPLAGVERRMLDRDGDEVARATTVVRYAPGSYFDPHEHSGGEEFLVLDGVFSDEHGDYPAGMYVRNPVGSAHRPHSEGGCTILVKLRQMDPADQSFVRSDTRVGPWQSGALDGVEVQILHRYGTEEVGMARLASGAQTQGHAHPGGVEILVLEGALVLDGGAYEAQSWIRLPPGEAHDIASEGGALLFVKLGHLVPASSQTAHLLSTA